MRAVSLKHICIRETLVTRVKLFPLELFQKKKINECGSNQWNCCRKVYLLRAINTTILGSKEKKSIVGNDVSKKYSSVFPIGEDGTLVKC